MKFTLTGNISLSAHQPKQTYISFDVGPIFVIEFKVKKKWLINVIM